MGTKIELQAEMEDGAVLQAVADQRDIARWEVQEEARIEPAPVLTRMRFLAYSALFRQQLLACSWPEFQNTCVNVDTPERVQEQPEQEDEQGLDPGRTEATASA